MAPRLTRWAWAVIPALVCLAIALVYLPPRPAGPPRGESPMSRRAGQLRERAVELAAEWEIEEFGRRAVGYRLQLAPELRRRWAADSPTVAVLLLGPDSVTGWARERVETAIRRSWHELGLGVTKVAVGVVVDMDRRVRPGALDSLPGISGGAFGTTYLLPDSLDQATCIALLPAPYFLDRRLTIPPGRLETWLHDGLGPCAFYARFGVPGARVRGWLARRRYDLATWAVWDRPLSAGFNFGWLRPEERNYGWWWEGIYGLKFSAVACLGGRPPACLASVREGDTGRPGSARVVVPLSPWRFSRMDLLGGGRWLSDVVRATGDARFREFWLTELPVDSALTLALRRPVGEWTVGWQAGISAPPPFGPWVPARVWLSGLVAAGLTLLLLAVALPRREVR